MHEEAPPSTFPGDEARRYLQSLREERESLEKHMREGRVTRGEFEEVQEVFSRMEARLRSAD